MLAGLISIICPRLRLRLFRSLEADTVQLATVVVTGMQVPSICEVAHRM